MVDKHSPAKEADTENFINAFAHQNSQLFSNFTQHVTDKQYETANARLKEVQVLKTEIEDIGKEAEAAVEKMREKLRHSMRFTGEEKLLLADAREYETCLSFNLAKLVGLLNKDIDHLQDEFEKAKQAKVGAKSALDNLLAEQQKMLSEFVKQYQTGTIPAKPFTPELTKLPPFGDKEVKHDLIWP